KVTVSDNTAPTLTKVPAGNQTVNATSPAGAVVHFTVSASDPDDAASAPGCNHNDGDTFPIGTTAVHCTSTGTNNKPGTLDFNVTVNGAHAQIIALEGKVNGAGELVKKSKKIKKLLITDLKAADTAVVGTACTNLAKFITDVTNNTPPITAAHKTDWL